MLLSTSRVILSVTRDADDHARSSSTASLDLGTILPVKKHVDPLSQPSLIDLINATGTIGGSDHGEQQQHPKRQAREHASSSRLLMHNEGLSSPALGVLACALLVNAAVASGCATMGPSRPAIADVPPGAPLVDPPRLVDTDADERTVDVRLNAPAPAVVEANAGDAVVVRVPPGTLRFTVDDAKRSTIESAPSEESVLLLDVPQPRAYVVRTATEPARVAAVIVAKSAEPSHKERVLFLDDDVEGIERQGGLGNVLRVNGQRRPTLTTSTGTRERWHLVNTSQARSFTVLLPGHVFVSLDGKHMGEVELPPGAVATVDVELGTAELIAFDLVTLDGERDLAEAFPLVHVVVTSSNSKEGS